MLWCVFSLSSPSTVYPNSQLLSVKFSRDSEFQKTHSFRQGIGEGLATFKLLCSMWKQLKYSLAMVQFTLFEQFSLILSLQRKWRGLIPYRGTRRLAGRVCSVLPSFIIYKANTENGQNISSSSALVKFLSVLSFLDDHFWSTYYVPGTMMSSGNTKQGKHLLTKSIEFS